MHTEACRKKLAGNGREMYMQTEGRGQAEAGKQKQAGRQQAETEAGKDRESDR
jgi:hypothetical protein